MQPSIRHFVRRILGIHLLLLVLLLAVVTMAARHVYQTARQQALEQTEARQTLLTTQTQARQTLQIAQAQARLSLLAAQTAHGVDGFYRSILSDLTLLKPDEEELSDLPDIAQLPADPRPLQNMAVVRHLVRQLQGRAVLFLVDERMISQPLGAEEHPIKAMVQAMRGSRNGTAPTTAPVMPVTFEQEVTAKFSPWLKNQQKAAISGLELFNEKGLVKGVKLVSIPFFVTLKPPAGSHNNPRTVRTGWLVAAVSAFPIEHNFLTVPSEQDVSGAFLVDESMTVMAAWRHELVGTQLNHSTDPAFLKAIAAFGRSDYSPQTLDHVFRIGDVDFDTAMMSASPVDVMGKRWFVLMTSPAKDLTTLPMKDLATSSFKDVDGVMRELWGKALFWAIFVAVSMTAIFVSTAAQLIYSRMKMERVRHSALQNEMRQARQIQLAWLPQKTKTTCSASMLDIASLNRPATHISGDFYNFFELPDGRTAVIIGDVTGHGTAAAFLMATTQLLIRNTLPQSCDPGQCLEDVNHQLTNQVFNGQFVTMQILVIDSRTGEVAIATAGHPAPLVGDGESFQPLKIEPQLVAGVDSKTKYPTEHFHLRPGTSILLYTDGVVETEDPAGKCLRLDGLRRALSGRIDNAETLLQRAVSAVNTFRRGQELRDDLTLVAVHLLPQSRPTPHAMAAPPPVKALPAAQLR